MTGVNYNEKIINEFMGYEYSEDYKVWAKPLWCFIPANSRGIKSGRQIIGWHPIKRPYYNSVEGILEVFEKLEFCKYEVCWNVEEYECTLVLVNSYTACEKTIPLAMSKCAVMAIERLDKTTSED